jgi:hypothetical protein
MENVGIFGKFYSCLVYFMAILVHFRGNLLYFSRFGIFCQEKSGSPAPVAAQTYF